MNTEKFYLDLSQLRLLSGDDDEFTIDILESIQEESPEAASAMSSLLAEQDMNKLGATAHRFKSTVNVLGNTNMNGLLKDIENNATDGGSLEDLQGMVQSFQQMCDLMLESIQLELDKLRA
ncbi:MAG: Hpt domain-containing protein [Bacteroidota bacterium]